MTRNVVRILTAGALLAALMSVSASPACAQGSAGGNDITTNDLSFTSSGITVLPFNGNGTPGVFGSEPCCVGVLGGTNPNAVDNADGLEGGTDSEYVEFRLTAGIGLTGIDFTWTRANPIVLSGFLTNPLTVIDNNPNGDITTAWDASTGSVWINHPWQGGAVSEFSFMNSGASGGQTITLSLFDSGSPGPQVAINNFAWDVAVTIISGDVNGDLEVDMEDFGVIRDNWFSDASPTRAMGDLTGDGIVEFDDFAQWKDNFPFPVAGNLLAELMGVPEPSAVALGAIALSAGLFMRRRKQTA